MSTSAKEELYEIENKYRSIKDKISPKYNIFEAHFDFRIAFKINLTLSKIDEKIKKIRETIEDFKIKKIKDETFIKTNELLLNKIENDIHTLENEETNNYYYYNKLIIRMRKEYDKLNDLNSETIYNNVCKGLIELRMKDYFKYEKKLLNYKDQINDLIILFNINY